LNANPQLFPEQLNKDPLFRNLALQTVGLTGYTCIYSSPDNSGKSSVWVHPNEKIIGVDLPPTMQKSMGPQYEEWFKIYRGAYNGNASSGYYKWLEKDGSIKDKYMTCYPLEGTSYILAATTYVDEIVREVKQLKTTGDLMTAKTFKLIGAVFIITCCVMGGAVLIYGRRLRSNLTQLTDAAERISIGELNTLITIKSHDEISDLADSISRMQESIRLSIERLRRKR
jgi:methyl-accepting chemotaxis protein